jgi:hypothetical protein
VVILKVNEESASPETENVISQCARGTPLKLKAGTPISFEVFMKAVF